MTGKLKGISLLLSILVVAAPGLAQAQGVVAAVAHERVEGTMLSVVPTIGVETAVLRVVGPGGYSLAKISGAGAITVDLLAEGTISPSLEGAQARLNQGISTLPDGRYKYEAIFTEPSGNARVFTGLFFVQGGSIVSREAMRDRLGEIRQDLAGLAIDAGSAPAIERIPPSPTANVDDLLQVMDTAGDNSTRILLQNATIPPGSNWQIRNEGGDIRFREYDGSGFEDLVTIEQGGQVGIGTTAPAAKLNIVDSVPVLQIETTDLLERWQLYINPTTDEFRIRDRVNFSHVVALKRGAPSDSIFVAADGKVGLGTETPGAPLEIAPGSGNAAFRLNFPGNETWTIANTGSIVTFNLIGSGGQEATFNRRFDAGGGPTFDVQGSVRGTQFISSSSREVKTNFVELDGQEVLSKLAAMPINSWSYKHDQSASRHFGPVAEDFQASFGLGDGKTISTVDAQGVTMAAIQGLNEKLEAREAEIEALKQANSALEARLAALEQKIE